MGINLLVGCAGGLNTTFFQREIVGENMVKEHENATTSINTSAEPKFIAEGGNTGSGLTTKTREILQGKEVAFINTVQGLERVVIVEVG